MTSHRKLFTPFTLNSLTFPNRAAVAPMTRISATDKGNPTEEMASYYTTFAKGGFGLIITEGTYIDSESSQAYENQPGMATDEQAKGWEKIAQSVHEYGSKIIMQLQHAGALSQANLKHSGTVAPSAIQPKGEQLAFYRGTGSFETPGELTIHQMEDIKHNFVHAALRAKSAGFDGVELHGANGYLLDNFLTDYTNQRNDKYGGSLVNRLRFLIEVIEDVKKEVGEFVVGIRISQSKGNDFTHKWAGGEEEAKFIFSELSKTGIDYIHVTEYDATAPAFAHNTMSLAALARKFSDVPIFANGQLGDPEKAIAILEKNEADLVTIGKFALANHDWVKKVRNDESLDAFQPREILHPIADLKPFEY
ncbi:NADH:flavin oxidoreductase [Sporosarcina aquimarina]|uniref:NADH:flavin oxidoreductase n=1 Tax=Sporosarcina aquimarina TaxID=114975 RepID=A0ABU4G2Q8_9BACL|nr:NADH:flavin oxidoreductase [Sporosarcina aquimarina]